MKQEMITSLLLQQKQELEKRIKGINNDIDNQYAKSTRNNPNAFEHAREEVLNKLANESMAKLELTNQALKRVSQGTLGRCLRCGRDIEADRLMALPHTEYCRDCARIYINEEAHVSKYSVLWGMHN